MTNVVALKPKKRTSPNIEKRTVRKYLTQSEVTRLIKAAGKTQRYALRNQTLVTVMFNHGLRVAEASELEWQQIDFKSGAIHIHRKKNGKPSVQHIRSKELRLLRRLKKEQGNLSGDYVFQSERGGSISPRGIQKLLERIGEEAKFGFKIHPHMLRHATGYYLANNNLDTRLIQDYLGHKNIQHTVRYTELNQSKFNQIKQLPEC